MKWNIRHRFLLFVWTFFFACNSPEKAEEIDVELSFTDIPQALLASRLSTLDEFKKVVDLSYHPELEQGDTSIPKSSQVTLVYGRPKALKSILKSGVSQDDILAAKEGNLADKMSLVFRSPYAISNRKLLQNIYALARRMHWVYGESDIAFFDFAQQSTRNIVTPELAYIHRRDASEKGYINTFNHITAQAFITSLYNEELADFIADVHELHNMPELTHGHFSEKHLLDSNNFPVDNYIDMINNEIGQELGKKLKHKYRISHLTKWDTDLLCNYLNDLQTYYAWCFGIGFKPFKQNDLMLTKFVDKLNAVMHPDN